MKRENLSGTVLFQVETLINPYQGLKPGERAAKPTHGVETLINPYQGLKLENSAQTSNYWVETLINPYQGLKPVNQEYDDEILGLKL